MPAIHRSRLFTTATRFCTSREGSTGMIFALSFIPILLVAGSAVDLSRAVREKSELSASTDGTALTLGKYMKTETVQQLATRAAAFLSASNTAYTLDGLPSFPTTDELCINTQTAMPTTIMQVVQINSIALSAKACVKLGGTSYEIALSLDTTGSMSNGGKIGSMRTAAKNFIDSVLPGGTQNNYVKVSIVPFASAVKAFDPDMIAETGNNNEATRYNANTWLDTGGNSAIHWENFPKPSNLPAPAPAFVPTSRFNLFANLNQKWAGCLEARPGAFALTDAAPNATVPNSLFVPLFAPDEGDDADNAFNDYMDDTADNVCVIGDKYDVMDSQMPYFNDGQSMLCKYKASSCTTAIVAVTSCKKKKKTTICTTTNVNQQICGAGPFTTPITSTSTIFVSPASNKGPNRSCISAPVMQLSNNAATLKAKVDTLSASGNTNIIEGVTWGWRSISPNGPYGGVESYTKTNHKKVLVLMTDGANTWSTNSNNENISDYSPFGFFWNNRLGSAGGTVGNVTSNNVRNYMDAKTIEACTAAKAAGIEIHTVAFSVPGDEIDTQGINLLKACATDISKYYLATDASGLNLAFQNIGSSLAGLHLSK